MWFFVFQVFVEARRTSPSIIYIPSIGQWWETAGPVLRATFLSLLSSVPAFAPIFLLATCSIEYKDLSAEVQQKNGPEFTLYNERKICFQWFCFFSPKLISLLICLSQVQELFQAVYGEVFHIQPPSSLERRKFFEDLIINQASKAPASKKKAGKKKKKRAMEIVMK